MSNPAWEVQKKKPFVRKFVLVFIFFCCASESVNEQLGLPVKKRMRSHGMKCAGKTLSFVRLMSPMQWLSFFPSNLSSRKSNITVKKSPSWLGQLSILIVNVLSKQPAANFKQLIFLQCTVSLGHHHQPNYHTTTEAHWLFAFFQLSVALEREKEILRHNSSVCH